MALLLGRSLYSTLLLFYLLVTYFNLTCAEKLRRLSTSVTSNDERSSKLFPLFSIVRISNQPCTPESTEEVSGTCYTNSQCRNAGGTASGTCASGFGVCCVVTATCDSVVTQNNTHFRNRDFPSAFNPTGLEVCNIRFQKPSTNVCQLRLDFISMRISDPDLVDGVCMSDQLSINGVSGSAPSNLCGDLSGQHMYLDYGSSDRITLSILTDGAASIISRQWNIKITYIECNSRSRAPDGCLQYYTSATGQVKMLGYPTVPHLASLDYTVCVRSEDGAGSILWSQCQGEPVDKSFLLTGEAVVPPADGVPGESCVQDYVLIMTDISDPTATKTDDRYCGNVFGAMAATPTVLSIAKPFIMRVKTDATEPDGMDTLNTGFCLAFRQQPPVRG